MIWDVRSDAAFDPESLMCTAEWCLASSRLFRNPALWGQMSE